MNNIVILGAAGFIGTNLVYELAKNKDNYLTLVDKDISYFDNILKFGFTNLNIIQSDFSLDENYDSLLKGKDIIYHLVSSTVPTTSNQHITEELKANVLFSSCVFEACVRNNVKKVVFISSGGTVYGKEAKCPLSENTPTNPITSYGIQKITIEKLLYLYNYMYGLDYRIIRLANPYGPYQRPNGVLGAVTTFTYKALMNEEIQVYGDGSIIRDFIYIDDAIKGIKTIVESDSKHHTFNLGSGYGSSIKQVLDIIEKALNTKINIKYLGSRKVDVPVNYLDISRYEDSFGCLNPISLEEGIKKTADFMRGYYHLEGK